MRFLDRLITPQRSGAPSSPTDGEVWYDTVLAKFRGRQNGVTVDLVNTTAVSNVAAPGVILAYSGLNAPTGWLLCHGQFVSQTSYATLFAEVGHRYNGDVDPGNGTFRLPDLRGRTIFGKDDMGGNDAGRMTINDLGGTGGVESAMVALLEMPSHTHGGTTGNESVDHTHSGTTGNDNIDHGHSGTTGTVSADHGHGFAEALTPDTTRLINTTAGTNYRMNWGGGVAGTGGISANHVHGFSTGGRSAFHQHSFTTGGRSAAHTHSFTTGAPTGYGSQTELSKMPPFMVMNYMISTGDSYVAGTVTSGDGAGADVGDMKVTARTTAPLGWLFAAGQVVSRTTYADLFAEIGTTYGAGDGSTTFALPDLRGRTVASPDNMGGTSANRLTTDASYLVDPNTVGATGGAQRHALTAGETPLKSHTHSISGAASASHTHTLNESVSRAAIGASAGDAASISYTASNVVQAPTTVTSYSLTGLPFTSASRGFNHHTPIYGATNAPSGAATNSGTPSVAEANGTAHSNLQPTILLPWVIYTGVV